MTPGKVARSLANPNSPHVKDALTRDCPDCHMKPGYWCVGTYQGHEGCPSTIGKPRKRIHFNRCEFAPGDISAAADRGRRAAAKR